MKQILILSGPNLNKLGEREPDIYGSDTLSDIENGCRTHAHEFGMEIDFRQSNSESELIEWIHDLPGHTVGLILNAAALTHTSVALHDALKLLDIPILEVHLSNPHQRESFRHTSYVSPVAHGVISGFGALSYYLAVEALGKILKK